MAKSGDTLNNRNRGQSQDSLMVRQQKAENRAFTQDGGEEPITDKKLDGPNRPSV